MTIRIKKDRIEFVSDEGTTFTLKETGDGFVFDGVIEGTNIFQNGFQGTIAGFSAGGNAPPESNVIDKFPFSTDTNATDVGDLTQVRRPAAGQSSTTHGYASGGYLAPPPARYNTIDKFLFATNKNATDVGDLAETTARATGQSSSTNGYVSGGNPPAGTKVNTIRKFPFATDTNATNNTGVLTQGRYQTAGQSSMSSGYTAGGYGPPQVNTIDKFPFASDSNATDVGDLTQARRDFAGQSSMTHGYSSGGTTSAPAEPGITNTIDKFPFSSDSNATDVGDLTQLRIGPAGQSSTSFGYTSGGFFGPPATQLNTIDKFPFSSDSNATDVGDLTQTRSGASGTQD
jgi:hypothetical protein